MDFFRNLTNYNAKSFKNKTVKQILEMTPSKVPEDFFTPTYIESHVKDFENADLNDEQLNAIELLRDLKDKEGKIITKCYKETGRAAKLPKGQGQAPAKQPQPEQPQAKQPQPQPEQPQAKQPGQPQQPEAQKPITEEGTDEDEEETQPLIKGGRRRRHRKKRTRRNRTAGTSAAGTSAAGASAAGTSGSSASAAGSRKRKHSGRTKTRRRHH